MFINSSFLEFYFRSGSIEIIPIASFLEFYFRSERPNLIYKKIEI